MVNAIYTRRSKRGGSLSSKMDDAEVAAGSAPRSSPAALPGSPVSVEKGCAEPSHAMGRTALMGRLRGVKGSIGNHAASRSASSMSPPAAPGLDVAHSEEASRRRSITGIGIGR